MTLSHHLADLFTQPVELRHVTQRSGSGGVLAFVATTHRARIRTKPQSFPTGNGTNIVLAGACAWIPTAVDLTVGDKILLLPSSTERHIVAVETHADEDGPATLKVWFS